MSSLRTPTAPAQRLAAVRLVVAAYALVFLGMQARDYLSYAGMSPARFRPVGVVALLPSPLVPALVIALVVATCVLALAFAAGWRHRVTGPAFAAALLWVTTYSNSWGMILHTDNLLVLDVALLALVPSADAWSLDARAGRTAPGAQERYGWPLQLLAAICVATYFIAGVAKLRNAGLAFANGETLLMHVAYDNVRKLELGSSAGVFAALALAHGYVFGFLAKASLLLELGAPLALLHRRAGWAWCALAWGFHLGVLAVMGIAFTYPLSGVAFAAFFPLEKLVPSHDRQATLAVRRAQGAA